MSKAKQDASPSVISIDAPALLGRSAADRAFDVPEIRQQILDISGRKDQMALMGLDRRWIFQAAEKLFFYMDYGKCRKYLKSDDPLHTLIATAISEIDCEDLDDAATREDLGLDPQQTLEQLRPEIFADFIPTLRDRCPNLRKISFGVLQFGAGDTTTGQSWAVTFYKTRPRRLQPGYVDSGHILIRYSLPHTSADHPPSTITFPAPPSADYTIETRFDVRFYPMDEDLRQGEWLELLQREDFSSHLLGPLFLGELRVTMEDLTNIFRWQNSSGYQQIVNTIDAMNCAPHTIHDFASFASIAGLSLESLYLHHTYDQSGPVDGFTDLPTLSAIIRLSLPNLNALIISLAGIDKVEAACGSALSDDCLDTSGNLGFLSFQVDSNPGRLPNAVRCVYGICAKDANLSFTWNHRDLNEDSSYVHQRLLDFLQEQPLPSRRVLATLDLTALSALI